jgi:hypothetical protein
MGDVRNYNNREVTNSDNDQIYATERKGLITYKIRVPDGTYDVSLLFAENPGNQTGERTFDIVIEDEIAADDLDIAALAGANSEYVLQREVQVTDEVIDIYFASQTDSAFVNAIEVEQLVTGIGNNHNLMPDDFVLYQNYPNPFNPATTISYSLPAVAKGYTPYLNSGSINSLPGGDESGGLLPVKLVVYDILGKKITTLVDEYQNPGNYSVTFSPGNLSSGIYFCQLLAGSKVSSIKMNLLK